LGGALEALGPRRTTMVLSLPGDRRDADLAATMRASLPFVSRYVLHDQVDLRERRAGEVPRLLAGCVSDGREVIIARDDREAILEGLRRTAPGERLVVIVDVVESALAVVHDLSIST